jgi:hypothetical protein
VFVFKGTVSNSDYIASSDSKVLLNWVGAVAVAVAYVEVLFQHLPAGGEGIFKK